MKLFDTNIFLEILLSQKKNKKCKKELERSLNQIYISDFSLHSIGVILFKHDKEKLFKAFLDDILPKVKIITLSKELYNDLPKIKRKYKLDFDDAYQFKITDENGFEIVTMDTDFKKVNDKIKVKFI